MAGVGTQHGPLLHPLVQQAAALQVAAVAAGRPVRAGVLFCRVPVVN